MSQSRRSKTADAWQQTRQNSRHWQLWLKHDVFAAGMNNRADFDSGHRRRPPPSTSRSSDSSPASSSRAVIASPELTSRKRVLPSAEIVDSVDDALLALSGYRDEYPVVAEEDHEWDWILDGHAAWHEQRQRSQELLAQLWGESTNGEKKQNLWDLNDENNEDLLLLQLGSRWGHQEYKFASFDEVTDADNDKSAPAVKLTTDDTNMGAFVETRSNHHDILLTCSSSDDNNDDAAVDGFQAPAKVIKSLTSSEKAPCVDDDSSEDFGDFVTATECTLKQTMDPSDDEVLSSTHPPDHAATMALQDDFDDFGDFQEAQIQDSKAQPASLETTVSTADRLAAAAATATNEKQESAPLPVTGSTQVSSGVEDSDVDHMGTTDDASVSKTSSLPSEPPAISAMDRSPNHGEPQTIDDDCELDGPPLLQLMDRTPLVGLTPANSVGDDHANPVAGHDEDKPATYHSGKLSDIQQQGTQIITLQQKLAAVSGGPLDGSAENEDDLRMDGRIVPDVRDSRDSGVKNSLENGVASDEAITETLAIFMEADATRTTKPDESPNAIAKPSATGSPSSPPEESKEVTGGQEGAGEWTPQPAIYNYSTPPKTKSEPKTPTTNNYSKSAPLSMAGRREHSSSTSSSSGSPAPSPARRSLANRFIGMDQDEKKQESEDRGYAQVDSKQTAAISSQDATTEDEEGESLTTEPSSGVPSVVQLFTTNPPPHVHSLVVPSTVRVMHSELSPDNDLRPEPTDKTPLGHPKDSPFTVASSLAIQSPHQHFNQSLARPLRLSLQLDRQSSIASQSTSSLASPEGRFLRRASRMRQLLLGGENSQRDFDGMNENDDLEGADGSDDDSKADAVSLGSLRSLLPDGYLWKSSHATPSQEVMDQMITNRLNGLEWDWIPFWKLDSLLEPECDASFVPLWLDQITQQLSDLDATHLKIAKRLYKLIQPHAGELEMANQAALELGKNLQLCRIYLERTQTSMKLAKYGPSIERAEAPFGGVLGAQNLLELWGTQESYSDLQEILDRVAELYRREKEILRSIETYDIRMEDSVDSCQAILNSINELRGCLVMPSASRLECLSELRNRVEELRSKTLIDRLHSWIETTTMRCCHASMIGGGLDSNEYQRLVQALLLAERRDNNGISKAFCTSIHTALMMEAQKSFGMALLNPTDSATNDDDSEYDKELLALSTKAYMDPSKMGVWIQNLVTIRFDFESSRNLLPAIYHKLCWQLTNVLQAFVSLLTWHKEHATESSGSESYAAVLMVIYSELEVRRSSIWNTCVKVLEECLEDYLKFSAKKKFFQMSDKGLQDESTWHQDLMGLADVLGLTEQFLSLRREFLVDVSEQFINDGSMLREKFFDIQKKHLRAFHVEAMNSMGLLLYREDWSLVSLPKTKPLSDKENAVEYIRKKIVTELVAMENRSTKKEIRSRLNRFVICRDKKIDHLAQFAEHGNPFDICALDEIGVSIEEDLVDHLPAIDTRISALFESYLGASPVVSPLLPACFIEGIFPWLSKLLLLLKMLPPIAQEVYEVFSNISDLYMTTAFRICSGSCKHERLLLGIQPPAPTLDPGTIATSRSQASSSQMFGFGRRPPSQPKPQAAIIPNLPPFTDAELCSPLPCELTEIDAVRDLIMEGQEKLKTIAKLDLVDGWVVDPNPAESRNLSDLVCRSARVLEKRQAASWGYVFLAATLQLASNIAKQQQSEGGRSQVWDDYVSKVIAATPKLVEICNRISCIRAIRGRVIVQQILLVGSGWEESKLHEHPNQYVDSVCQFAALLWCSLCNANKMPLGSINRIWSAVVEGGFASLLEGFSRIPFCSTEGRALMSMDLASFTGDMRGRAIQERLQGHASAPDPPPVATVRGMAYVDTYIKVFYFPPMDALNWIQENFEDYRMNHMVALIVGSAVSSSENRRESLVKLVNTVKELYKKHSKEPAKVASI